MGDVVELGVTTLLRQWSETMGDMPMPSVSKKQHNAMAAAAFGKSTLGIPEKVGKDFIKADKAKKKKKNAGRKK